MRAHRWVEPRGRNERERVSQIVPSRARVREGAVAKYRAARALVGVTVSVRQ
jgi:hypothetical protein